MRTKISLEQLEAQAKRINISLAQLKAQAESLLDEAESLLEKGKLRRAESVLKRLLAIDGRSIGAHFNLTRVYRRTGQFKEALYHGRKTLQLSPKEKNARLNLAMVYEETGQRRQALRYYKNELARNPNSAETLWNLGRLYFDMRRWLGASKCLHHCFDRGFGFEIEDTVDKLGICYQKLGSLRPYIEVFTRYIEMCPSATWAHSNLGRALLQVGDYRGAVLRLARARRLNPNSGSLADLERAKRLLGEKGLEGTASEL
jgi:protein O-GlcNAc transferase